MPWTTPETFTAGQTLTAASMNKMTGNDGFLYKPPMCRVYRSSDYSYSSGFITWNAEAYDTDGMWSSGDSITIQTAGVYMVTANITVTCSATLTWLAANIYRDSNSVSRNQAPAYSSTLGFCTTSALVRCSVGTVIKSVFDPFGGSSFTVKGGADTSADNVTSLTVAWVGNPA